MPVMSVELGIDSLLFNEDNQFDKLIFLLVTKILFAGAYVPLIAEGKIIVDGVLASCYADFHHDLAHLTMAPMQKFPEFIEWLFGEDIGYPVYVSTLRKMGMMLLPDEHFWN